MCITLFFDIKIALSDFRKYVQYEHALCHKTYTQMIAYTDFVFRHDSLITLSHSVDPKDSVIMRFTCYSLHVLLSPY